MVMSTITFDTFRFVETLEKAGMPRAQAAAFSQAQQFSLSEALDSSVATKADLIAVKSELKADLLSVRSELKADIVRLENRIDAMELRLTVKLGAFIAVAVASTAALVKLL